MYLTDTQVGLWAALRSSDSGLFDDLVSSVFGDRRVEKTVPQPPLQARKEASVQPGLGRHASIRPPKGSRKAEETQIYLF